MRRLIGMVVGGLLVLIAPAIDGSEPMRLHVTPAVSMAPGYVTVRVNVPADPENRGLQIVAESPDFYRSSQIAIDGAHGAPLNVFEFRNLPSGVYEVTGTLIGANGPRATAQGVVKVQPGAGQ